MEAATLTLGSAQCTTCTRAWATTVPGEDCPYCGTAQRAPERRPQINHTLAVPGLRPGGPEHAPADHQHDGNPAITAWCETCQSTVVPMRWGGCGWCDARLEDVL